MYLVNLSFLGSILLILWYCNINIGQGDKDTLGETKRREARGEERREAESEEKRIEEKEKEKREEKRKMRS